MLPFSVFGFTISRGEPAAESVDNEKTPAEQLALMEFRHAARNQMRAVSHARTIRMLVLVISMVISYTEQRDFVLRHHFGRLQGLLIPIVFDLATIFFITVMGARAMRWSAVITSGVFVLIPVGVSAYINFSSAADFIGGCIAAAVVALIPEIEIVGALIGANFRRMRATEADIMRAATETVEAPKSGPRKGKKVSLKRGDKRDKIVEILSRTPNLSPRELAALAGVSHSYAAKHLAELRSELVTT